MLQSPHIKSISNRSVGIFSKAVEIQTALHNLGFQSVIAGGFARDLFFGIEPKDCDIIVFGPKALELESALFFGKVTSWENTETPLCLDDLFSGGVWCSMYSDKGSEEATQDRVAGVYQLPHHNVDVIVYEDVEDAQGVIDAFDFNLNQFALVQDHEKGICYPDYFGHTDLRTLCMVRNDSSDQRKLKVAGKHSALLPVINQYYDNGVLSCD